MNGAHHAEADVFDYIVVGAGAAGCVLAARLTEDPDRSLCLLEAGGRDSNPYIHIPAGFIKTFGNPSLNWGFQTEPTANTGGRPIWLVQGKVLGGGTSINGMVAVRGQASDYDSWAADGATGWDAASLHPYFRKLETMAGAPNQDRGSTGPYRIETGRFPNPACDAFIGAAEGAGMPGGRDYNGPNQISAGYTQRSIAGRFRVSAATAYLGPSRRRPNLDIRTGATAEAILFEGKRAVGVRYTLADGSISEVRARREVIVSTGAINTPRLLQLSGVGPLGLLRELGIEPVSALDGVGANLRDHYMVSLVARGRAFPSFNQMSRAPRLWLQVLRWLAGRPSLLTVSPAAVSFFASTKGDPDTADIQGIFNPANYKSDKSGLDDFPGMTCTVWQHRPESHGFVRAVSRDIATAPLIQPNYLDDERDQATLVAALRLARQLLLSPQMAPFLTEELAPGRSVETDAEWLDYARQTGSTVYHPIGTARIGADDDARAVVDTSLQVRGTQGLRVVDASVMPSLTSGNTAIPTLMIAEKAADLIRAEAA